VIFRSLACWSRVSLFLIASFSLQSIVPVRFSPSSAAWAFTSAAWRAFSTADSAWEALTRS